MNSRTAAVQILSHLNYPYHQYERAIKEHLAKKSYKQADSDFINLLVRGVIIHQSLLDFILTHALRHPLKKLEKLALTILRVGVFQSVVLQMPAHAVVHETVESTRRLGRADLAGLVNGVLRHLPEEAVWRRRLAELEPVEALSIEYSHPTWLVERWLRHFGPEATRQLLVFNNSYQEIIWRHNPLRIASNTLLECLIKDGYQATVVSEAPTLFFTVNEPGRLLKSKFFQDGWLSIQDYSQALMVQLLAPQPDEVILDLCAAPGGKATYIAQLTRDRAQIHAYDISQQRLKQIEADAGRMGIRSIVLQRADARSARFPQADKILIDAPCSGTGVVARRSNLRWNRKTTDIDLLPRRQQAILENAARYLKPGGILVYGTCSLEPEENWGVVADFINHHPEFVVDSADKYVAAAYCDRMGAIQVLPFRHNFTGSFAVRLVKMGDMS